jgi:hypothetical protein
MLPLSKRDIARRSEIRQQISSANNPLHPRFSVLALLPQMTREIQDQQPTAARPAAVHYALTLDRDHHLGEEKANRNIRFTEIQLCAGKQATKQFSNRNKNVFFGFLKGPEIGEKLS